VITALPDADQLFGFALGLVLREAEGPVERHPVPVNMLDLPKGSNGSFELRGVRAGSYDLIVRSHTPNADYFSKVPVDVHNRDVKDVVVTLNPGMDVRGRLVVEGSPDCSVRLRAGPLATMPPLSETGSGFIYASARSHGRGDISLELSRKDGIQGGRYNLGPLVDESGTSFTFPNVPEGAYTISARGGLRSFLGSDTYLADIRIGGRSVFDDGAFVVGTDPVDTLEIVVRTNGGSVQGTVLDKQDHEVQLLLMPDPPRRTNPARDALITLTEKSRGEFTLRGIPPGDYKLLAISGADRTIPFRSKDFLAKYESRMTAVTIRDGVRVSVQIPLV
jgi:hypothetical protein